MAEHKLSKKAKERLERLAREREELRQSFSPYVDLSQTTWLSAMISDSIEDGLEQLQRTLNLFTSRIRYVIMYRDSDGNMGATATPFNGDMNTMCHQAEKEGKIITSVFVFEQGKYQLMPKTEERLSWEIQL